MEDLKGNRTFWRGGIVKIGSRTNELGPVNKQMDRVAGKRYRTSSEATSLFGEGKYSEAKILADKVLGIKSSEPRQGDEITRAEALAGVIAATIATRKDLKKIMLEYANENEIQHTLDAYDQVIAGFELELKTLLSDVVE